MWKKLLQMEETLTATLECKLVEETLINELLEMEKILTVILKCKQVEETLRDNFLDMEETAAFESSPKLTLLVQRHLIC